MRLIDGAIQALPMSDYIIERKDTFIKVLQRGNNDYLFAMLMDYFDNQQTSYDIDKVVEQLKEWSFNADVIVGDGEIINGNLIARDNAIEIVKDGGVK